MPYWGPEGWQRAGFGLPMPLVCPVSSSCVHPACNPRSRHIYSGERTLPRDRPPVAPHCIDLFWVGEVGGFVCSPTTTGPVRSTRLIPITRGTSIPTMVTRTTTTRQTAWNRERALISEITERRAEREEGRQEGRQEGTLETKITMLEKLLSKRFSPLPEGTLERINRATPEQLEHWILAVIDAPTLEAVFVEH